MAGEGGGGSCEVTCRSSDSRGYIRRGVTEEGRVM